MAFAGTVLGGPYTITYGGAALGIMLGDTQAPTILVRHFEKRVDNTDQYGRQLLDSFFLGHAARANMTSVEWLASITGAVWLGSATLGTSGQVGRSKFASMAAALVLTAVAGTPAATSPATLTMPKAVMAADFDTRWLFGPTNRESPMEFEAMLNTGPALFSTT